MMLFTVFFTLIFLFTTVSSAFYFYTLIVLLGFGIGYWAMFVTIGAEQFGTNLRATAATTIPNMVRGMVMFMTTGFIYFKQHFTVVESGAIIGLLCFVIGIYAITSISETHDRDLDFLED